MPAEIKSMTIKLKTQDRERLKQLAEARKRTPHWLAKEAISQYLEREEAVERFRRESLDAWNEFLQTGESVPNEKVMEWLDSWETEDETEAPSCK
jgi:predicted transcriptional regulator